MAEQPEAVTIDLGEVYGKRRGMSAKLRLLDEYLAAAEQMAAGYHTVILTGQAPIWLYLKVAHALHGTVRKLLYSSPVTGKVLVFDHDPF